MIFGDRNGKGELLFYIYILYNRDNFERESLEQKIIEDKIKKIRLNETVETKGSTSPRKVSPFFKFPPIFFFFHRPSAVRKANKRVRFLPERPATPKIRRFNRVYRRFKCGLTSAPTLAPSQWETGDPRWGTKDSSQPLDTQLEREEERAYATRHGDNEWPQKN